MKSEEVVPAGRDAGRFLGRWNSSDTRIDYPSLVTRYSLLIIVLVLTVSCGRKGPPTLKAYEKPQAPSRLSAIHREAKIILAWSYPDNLRDSLKGFVVLRSGGGGPFEKIETVENDRNTFLDGTFETDRAYRYKVVAVNPKGVASNDSNIVSVVPKPLPLPPEAIRFRIMSDSMELTWKSSGEGICYNVYRSLEKGKFSGVPLNGEPVCKTSFEDTRLFPETTVYYVVRSLHDADVEDEGYASQEIAVAPSDFVPSAPGDLRIVEDTKVYLTWKESAEAWVRGYRVFRRTGDEKEFTPIGEVKVPSFTDAVRTGKKVWYMIRAIGPVKESEPLTGEAR
ncbi:MAG: hypothetical protein M1497_07550 [Nitrospirae bacterium]|nr:hypothetical protein [Nitrospirota bacterium]